MTSGVYPRRERVVPKALRELKAQVKARREQIALNDEKNANSEFVIDGLSRECVPEFMALVTGIRRKVANKRKSHVGAMARVRVLRERREAARRAA